jgi:hypothetical protein
MSYETFGPSYPPKDPSDPAPAEKNGCRKCGAEMLPGVALVNRLVGIPDFIGSRSVVTVSPDTKQPLQVRCLKCMRCGWSVTV